ncbi:MAG: hypothetical protein AAFQ52_17525, partial [Chloroflexota bacterium]
MNEDIERIVGDYVIVEGSVFGDNLAKRKDATDDDAQFFFVERVSRLNDENSSPLGSRRSVRTTTRLRRRERLAKCSME